MTGRQLLEAVRRIAVEMPLVGVDVVEVAPAYDSSEITAALANRVVLEVLSGIAFRRKGASGADVTPAPRPWPPQLP
jgi:arginase family enzyme